MHHKTHQTSSGLPIGQGSWGVVAASPPTDLTPPLA